MDLESGRRAPCRLVISASMTGTLGNWAKAWRREHAEPDQPVGAENPVTSRYPQVFVDQSAEAIPP
jgi:hypothetical protein